MPYAEREFVCIDCKVLVKRRAKAGTKQRCFNCAIFHASRVVAHLYNHEGEYYDKWRKSMANVDWDVASERWASAMRHRMGH